jgi:di/tricarboxylate transporter
MPFVFSSHAGSMLALTGTPVNVLVSDVAEQAGAGSFGFFEFTIVGVPLLLGTIAIIVLFGEKLLPHRSGEAIPADLSRHALTLVEQYRLGDGLEKPFDKVTGLAEVVIPPRSGMIGRAVFPGMVTDSGDLVILAVQRKGENLAPGEALLAAGDTLLLQGTWKALDKHLADPDVLVVDSPELVRRQAVPMGQGAVAAIAVLLLMVVALATGAVPSVIAALVAACALVLLRVLSVEQAYRSVNWTTVILVGAMIPLSTAMTESGAAGQLADLVVQLVRDGGPYALLAGFFVLTAILGQLISNMATAILIIPIALAAALEMGISPRPMLMCVTVAAAAALLTPVATPVNLMVMGPGGYRFSDYAKFGLPIMLWFLVIGVFYVPFFWPF